MEEADINARKSLQWILSAGLVLVAAGMIYSRWRESGFRWDLFARTFIHLNWLWVALTALLTLAAYAGRVLRWAVMIRPVKAHPSFGSLFASTAIGFTAIVLFGRPGEFVRPYLIAVRERVSFSSQMAAWLLERIYDLLAVAVIFGIGLSQVHATEAQLSPGMAWVLRTGGYTVTVIAALCFVVLFVFRRFSHVLRSRVAPILEMLPPRFSAKSGRVLDSFLDGMRTTQSVSAVALILFYTFLEWILVILSIFCIFRAFPDTAELRLMESLILVGFIAFGSIIQIPGIGGGMQVATVVVLSELFRLPLEAATSIAIAFWLLNFAIIVPFGVIFAFRQGVHWRSLRHIPVLEES